MKTYTYLPIDKSKEIYKDYNRKEFKDITEKWVKFLKSDRYKKKNSFILWHLAGRDWGKTAEAFKEINLLLEKNRKRFVQILKAPPDFIKNIEEVCPEEYKGRFESLPKLRFLRKNAILVIDEGLLGANAKEALTKEMRRLSKFTSKSRHPNIIVIINSVNLGILGEFKDMIDITIYKHLGYQFFVRNRGKDKFIDQHEKLLSHLKEWEGIIISSYKKFNYERGKISLKYEDYCPWFNDNLSLNQQDTNPDADFEDEIQLSKEIERLAKMAVNELGYRLLKPLAERKLKGWLQAEHKELYYDFEKYIPRILTLAYYMAEEMVNQTNQDTNNEFVEIIEMLIREKGSEFKHKGVNYLKNWLYEQFPDIYHSHKNNINKIFNIYLDYLDKQKQQKKAGISSNFKFNYTEKELFNLMEKEVRWQNKERDIAIYKERQKGTLLDDIAKQYEGLKQPAISRIIKKVEGAINYYSGKLFENKFSQYLNSLNIFDKVILDGSSGETDIFAYKNNRLYIFSLKNLKIDGKKYKIKKEDLRPEFKKAYKGLLENDNVFLFLIVFDNSNNKVIEKNIDFRNPTDININPERK